MQESLFFLISLVATATKSYLFLHWPFFMTFSDPILLFATLCFILQIFSDSDRELEKLSNEKIGTLAVGWP